MGQLVLSGGIAIVIVCLIILAMFIGFALAA